MATENGATENGAAAGDGATSVRVDGRDALRFERRFAHPMKAVWRALTDPGDVMQWTTATMVSDGTVGGRIDFRFANGDGDHEGTISVFDPPRVLQYSWGEDVLRWELEPVPADGVGGEACRLVFTHIFGGRTDDAAIATTAAGWHTHLEQLDALLDGAPIPWSADRWIEHKQRYAAEFDVHGRLTTVDGRPRVRFSRLLPHPPEEVFRAVTDNELLRLWYPATIEGERKPGAAIVLHATDVQFPPSGGEIRTYDPPHLFEYTWGEELLRFEVWDFGGAFGGRCRLIFTDLLGPEETRTEENGDGEPDEVAAAYAALLGAWHHGLERLEAALAGTPIPIADRRVDELTEHYREGGVEAGWLDPSLLSGGPVGADRSRLRLERTLSHPVGRVWEALTDPALIRQWMDPVELEPGARPGDRFEVVYRGFDEPPATEELRVRQLERTLSYTWQGGAVRWDLEPSRGRTGTRLVCVVDMPYRAEVGCASGWSVHHDMLEALLDGDVTRRPDRPYGTVATLDGRQVFSFSRRLSHPVERVWRALTDPDDLAGWFPSGMETTFEPGAGIRFPFGGDEAPVMTGSILEVEPPQVLAYTWGEDVLRWELEADGDGTRLWFTTITDNPDFEQVLKNSAGWHACVDELEAVLAGPNGSVDSAADGWKEHYLAYNRRFTSR